MKERIIIMTLVILGLFSCKKEKTNVEGTTQMSMTDITPMDINGTQIGPSDMTDWTKETNWTNTIINLFNFSDTINYNASEIASIAMYPNYPNPIDSISIFNFGIDKPTIIKYVIVDDQ